MRLKDEMITFRINFTQKHPEEPYNVYLQCNRHENMYRDNTEKTFNFRDVLINREGNVPDCQCCTGKHGFLYCAIRYRFVLYCTLDLEMKCEMDSSLYFTFLKRGNDRYISIRVGITKS